MNKRALKKSLEPASPTAAVERTYAVSDDGREVIISFKSDTPMVAMDVICAIFDFINDFVVMSIRGNEKDQ